MKKLRLGVIGCGNVKNRHINAIARNSDNISLVSLCDINVERARSFEALSSSLMRNKPSVTIYIDYREMLEKESLDMVSILTGSGKHYAIACDCIKHGVNVLVEKPLALSLEEVDTLTKMASVNKVKLGVVHQYRFNPYVKKLKDSIAMECFGRLFYGVTTVRWNRNKEYYDNAKWRGTADLDGGVLMNQCIQNIDILQWLLGEKAEEVYAYKRNYAHPYIETEDTVLALIKFGNGILGMVEGTVSTFSGNLENSIAVFGESGRVKIGGTHMNIAETWNVGGNSAGMACHIYEDKENPKRNFCWHSSVYRDFADKIKNRGKPAVDGVEARKSIEIVLAMQKSAETGMPVRLPF